MSNPISNFFQQQLTISSQDSLSAKKLLRDKIIEFFHRENWQFSVTQNPLILRMTCQGENGQWRCYAKVKETQQQFVFYSVCPIKTAPGKLTSIAEFITRANYGAIIGNFELDFDDGEIRYKTSIDDPEHVLTINAISSLVYKNILMMDRYLPGILAVLEQDLEPLKAITAIEASGDL